jgi:hypothetical protein
MRLPAQNLFAAVVVALTACSSPPHDLHNRGESRIFAVLSSSDQVYRTIVDGARTCYAKREVVADYFPDNKTAKVSMSVKTSLNIAALFVAEISPAERGTRVQVFFLKGNPVFADAVEQWTKGNFTVCPFG